MNESVDSHRQSRLQKPRPRALASTSKGTLRDVTPPPQPRILMRSDFSDKQAKKQKRSHNENSQLICICCLGKTNQNRPRKWSNDDSLCASLAALYPNFHQDKEFLPDIICQCCYDKLQVGKFKSAPVQSQNLVKNVKLSKCFDSGFIGSKNNDSVCEICKLATANPRPIKSQFLRHQKGKKGRPSSTVKPQKRITDLFPQTKNLSKRDKLEYAIDNLSPGTTDQFSLLLFERKEKQSETGEVSYKRVHGPERKLSFVDNSIQTIVSHSTLINIKCEIQASGNKMLKIAKILKDSCDNLKIEEYFKQSQIDHNKALADFFDHEEVDMEIYEWQDFQHWKVSDDNYLIDKIGHWSFHDKTLLLPSVGVPGFVEDASSGQVLTLKRGTTEVIWSSKIRPRTTLTRSSRNAASDSDHTDSQKWIFGVADSNGWFRIKNVQTGQCLTTIDANTVAVENLANQKDHDGKKRHKVKVKKTYAWCCELEAFICFIAQERDYTDENLKIEIGLDAGGDLLKLMMTVDEPEQPPSEIGTGEFTASPIKKKKKGKYMNKYKPRGVKGTFLIGVIRNCPETYENFKVILGKFNLYSFGFVPDFKAKRIALGLQSCSSTYSCSFCLWISGFDTDDELRTFESLAIDYEGYQALVDEIGPEKALKFAKKFHNATNRSLIKGDYPNQKILFKVLIDELHVYLGVGNHIFDSLFKIMNEDNPNLLETVYDWAYKQHICGLKYHGGALDGPNLDKLLDNLDSLHQFVPEKYHIYVEALRLFALVAKSCFSADKLWDNYKDYINEFKECYKKLEISVTPKAHVIFYEIPIFCDEVKQPLGKFSAQPFESMHFDFKPTYKCYMRPENHPQHGPKLKDAMVSYNGDHIILTRNVKKLNN